MGRRIKEDTRSPQAILNDGLAGFLALVEEVTGVLPTEGQGLFLEELSGLLTAARKGHASVEPAAPPASLQESALSADELEKLLIHTTYSAQTIIKAVEEERERIIAARKPSAFHFHQPVRSHLSVEATKADTLWEPTLPLEKNDPYMVDYWTLDDWAPYVAQSYDLTYLSELTGTAPQTVAKWFMNHDLTPKEYFYFIHSESAHSSHKGAPDRFCVHCYPELKTSPQAYAESVKAVLAGASSKREAQSMLGTTELKLAYFTLAHDVRLAAV